MWQSSVSSVIVGARTVAQLDDNLGADTLRLDPDEMAALERVSDAAPAAYPYGGPGAEQRSGVINGL